MVHFVSNLLSYTLAGQEICPICIEGYTKYFKKLAKSNIGLEATLQSIFEFNKGKFSMIS